MKAFHVIPTLLFIGGLSVINAQKNSQSNLSNKQQKEVVGQVATVIGNTVRSVVNSKDNGNSVNITSPEVKGNPYPEKCGEPKFGTALIKRTTSGNSTILCSGVLLSSWVMLTTGSCVDGVNRSELGVQMILKYRDQFLYKFPVDVLEVLLDPSYVKGQYQHNLALLLLGGSYEWDVYPFFMPRDHYTPDFFLNNTINTTIHEWADSDNEEPCVSVKQVKVKKDYSFCNAVTVANYSYCFEPLISGKETVTKVNIGTPLFFQSGNLKRVFGLFTGESNNKPTPGRLFIDVYQSIDWIDDYLAAHPFPSFHT